MTRSNWKFLIVCFALVLSVIFLGGCSSWFAQEEQKTTQPAKTTTGTPTKEATETTKTTTSTIPQVPMMIRTATIEIEVGKGEFQKKFDEAQAVAEQFDGYVTASNAERVKGELTSGTVTLRVPEKKFKSAIARLKKLGQVNKAEVKGEDVSEEYVDLESRLKNYQAQEAALLALMARAQSVPDTLAVQTELTKVQGEIEVITGRMNYLKDRVDFSTITVTIEEPSAVVPEADEWGFVSALRTAVRAFVATINGLIIVAGALAPIIILVALLWYLIRTLRKKKERAI